jgi:hypothetical protein
MLAQRPTIIRSRGNCASRAERGVDARCHSMTPSSRIATRRTSRLRRRCNPQSTRQALVQAPGAAAVSGRHQPFRHPAFMADDRAGARAIAPFPPSRLAGCRRVQVGQQGSGLLARTQFNRHAADRADGRRTQMGRCSQRFFGRWQRPAAAGDIKMILHCHRGWAGLPAATL